MHSWTTRLNAVFSFSGTVLGFMVAALALTSIFLTKPATDMPVQISVKKIHGLSVFL